MPLPGRRLMEGCSEPDFEVQKVAAVGSDPEESP